MMELVIESCYSLAHCAVVFSIDRLLGLGEH